MAWAWLVGGVLLLVAGVAWSLGTVRAEGESNDLRATVAAQATAVVQLRTRVYALELQADRAEERLGWIADDLAELPRSSGGAIIWGAVLGEGEAPGADSSASGDVVTFSPTPEGGLGWLTIVEPDRVVSCNISRNSAATGGEPGAYFPGGPPDYLFYCP